jgi:hypothetical protein
MSLSTVFDVGTRILRRHWSVLLLLALLFVGPGALLSSATALRFSEVFIDVFPELQDGVLVDSGRGLSPSELERVIDAVMPFLGASLLAGVLGSIGALGFSATVAEDYHARPAETGTVLRTSLRRTPSALVFMLVTGLLITGLIVVGLVSMSVVTLILPAASVGGGGPGVFIALIIAVALAVALVYLTMRWAPAFPSMVEEGVGWREALRRSWHLSGDNVLRIFVVSIVVALVTAMVSSVLGALFDALLTGFVGPALGLDELVTSTVALAVASVIVAPAMAVFTAVLYFDLRARRDVSRVLPPNAPGDPYA